MHFYTGDCPGLLWLATFVYEYTCVCVRACECMREYVCTVCMRPCLCAPVYMYMHGPVSRTLTQEIRQKNWPKQKRKDSQWACESEHCEGRRDEAAAGTHDRPGKSGHTVTPTILAQQLGDATLWTFLFKISSIILYVLSWQKFFCDVGNDYLVK